MRDLVDQRWRQVHTESGHALRWIVHEVGFNAFRDSATLSDSGLDANMVDKLLITQLPEASSSPPRHGEHGRTDNNHGNGFS